MMFFERTAFAHLQAWQSRTNRKPLLLQGTRQVGKTSLLKHFGKEAWYCYTMYDDDKRRAGEYSNETVQEATLVRLINANYHYNRPLPALYQWKDRKKRT
jgi:predicted AAA+ superfamily ATPase